jgi:hypothetical protein
MPNECATTKAEIVIVFVAVSAIIGFSYFTAHHAAVNTPADPVFRHLVRPESTKPQFKTEYLYVPLLFQVIAWLALGASLLPASIQESWLLNTQRWRRSHLYFVVVFCLLLSAGIYWNSSNALMRATSAPVSLDQSSSTSAPNSPNRTHAPQYRVVVLQIEFAEMDRSSLQSSSALRFAAPVISTASARRRWLL